MIKNTCSKDGTFSMVFAPAAETRVSPAAMAAGPPRAGATVAAAAMRTIAAAIPRPDLVRIGRAAFPQATAHSSATVSPSELEALKHVADVAPAVSWRSGRASGIPVRRIVIDPGC